MGLSDFFSKNHSSRKANCIVSTPEAGNGLKVSSAQEEYASDISTFIQQKDITSCSQNGVLYHDIPNMIRLEYDGVLAKGGAVEIYAVIGYGSNDKWEDVEYHQMHKAAGQTFELLIFRKRPGNINTAFKDGVGNWDNNEGRNYIFYSSDNKM